ncbi:MAG: response regulator [Campylobacterota bacterium]|nr:response regulator [Campylobacterota bacterium]
MYKNIIAVSIDDNEQNLMLLEAFADQIELKVINFSDPIKAFEFITNNEVDIIFTDYMMPDMNGLQLIEKFRETNSSTPIIMITAAGEDIKLDALKAGATDFLNKPLDLVEFTIRTQNLLRLREAQIILADKAKLLENEVKKATIELINREHESLIVLGKTAEYKDPETASHVARVANYSKILAKEYGLSEEIQECIFYASPFHDIGKVGIADNILLKPAKLTDEEFDVMKTHPTIGYSILKDTKSKYLKMGALISLTHHEKYNGTGYPNGLSADSIPIEGRIVAIADVFDALVSTRPYKKAWSFDDALELLKKESGVHFDPVLVELFQKNISSIKKIYDMFQES